MAVCAVTTINASAKIVKTQSVKWLHCSRMLASLTVIVKLVTFVIQTFRQQKIRLQPSFTILKHLNNLRVSCRKDLANTAELILNVKTRMPAPIMHAHTTDLFKWEMSVIMSWPALVGIKT
jgi:hypothetical protein